MPLSDNQIKFIQEHAKDAKDARDIVGLLYKTKTRQWIKNRRKPISMKEILLKNKRSL